MEIDHARPVDLEALAAAINVEHRSAARAFASGLTHAIRAGELLIEAKAQCPHGGWLGWLGDHFEGSERTAQAYMRVARRAEELDAGDPQRGTDLSFRDALAALVAPRVADDEAGAVPSDGAYAENVRQAAAALNRLCDSWWWLAQWLYEATTGDDAARLEDVCAAMNRPGERPFSVWEAEIRRATWIVYGALPPDDRPNPMDAMDAVLRLGVSAPV